MIIGYLKEKIMDLSDLIAPEGVVTSLKAGTKKQVLESLSEHAAQLTGLDTSLILESLLQRESLGSTGLGGGIAIPHSKMTGLDHVVCLFARMARPIEFDALDEEPVDLIFVLLAPESAGADHLKALARISRILRDSKTVERLRSSNDASALYAMLTENVAAA